MKLSRTIKVRAAIAIVIVVITIFGFFIKSTRSEQFKHISNSLSSSLQVQSQLQCLIIRA